MGSSRPCTWRVWWSGRPVKEVGGGFPNPTNKFALPKTNVWSARFRTESAGIGFAVRRLKHWFCFNQIITKIQKNVRNTGYKPMLISVKYQNLWHWVYHHCRMLGGNVQTPHPTSLTTSKNNKNLPPQCQKGKKKAFSPSLFSILPSFGRIRWTNKHGHGQSS